MIQRKANFIALFEKVTSAIRDFLLLKWDFFLHIIYFVQSFYHIITLFLMTLSQCFQITW